MKKNLALLLVIVATPLCGTARAADTIYHYKEGGVTHYFSDRKVLPGGDYVYIGKYGRPTAVLSCTGMTPAKLEARADKFEPIITRQAEDFGVDAALVKAVMRVESCFDPKAVSRVGARGLMQLMPGTASEMGVSDSFDPAQNIRGGVKYLSLMLKRFKQSTNLALAAYNAGPGAVERHRGIPPFRETQAYVKKVLSHYQHYRSARSAPQGRPDRFDALAVDIEIADAQTR